MRAYPNPDAVVYASTMPPRFPCQLTTQDPGTRYPMHNHGVWMDASGNGNTDLAAGHFHRVRNGRVLPDESDGHTHDVTMLPCGAGAARAVSRDDGMIAVLGDTPSAVGVRTQVELQHERQREEQERRTARIAAGITAAVVLGAVIGAVFLLRGSDE